MFWSSKKFNIITCCIITNYTSSNNTTFRLCKKITCHLQPRTIKIEIVWLYTNNISVHKDFWNIIIRLHTKYCLFTSNRCNNWCTCNTITYCLWYWCQFSSNIYKFFLIWINYISIIFCWLIIFVKSPPFGTIFFFNKKITFTICYIYSICNSLIYLCKFCLCIWLKCL